MIWKWKMEKDQEESVRLISNLTRPNGPVGPLICALIGGAQSTMAGGPLSPCAIKRGGDQWLLSRGWPEPTNPKPDLSEGRSQWREVPPPLHYAAVELHRPSLPVRRHHQRTRWRPLNLPLHGVRFTTISLPSMSLASSFYTCLGCTVYPFYIV